MWWSRETDAVQSVDGVSIIQAREDCPEFGREYATKLTTSMGAFDVTVKIKNYGWTSGLHHSGQVSQSDGRWIRFDPERVADKIIDRELFPKVQAFVDDVMVIDRLFRRNEPSEFTDRRGRTWARK